MDFTIDRTPWSQAAGDWLIVGVPENAAIEGALRSLDEALGGSLVRLQEAKDLTGKLAEVLPLRDVRGIAATRLLLVGLGPVEQQTDVTLYKAMITAARHISTKEGLRVAVALPTHAASGELPAEWIRATATAMQVGCVGQDLYRGERARFAFQHVHLLMPESSNEEEAQAATAAGFHIADGINLTRELVNQPAQVIFPASFADRARQMAEAEGLSCEILDEEALNRERMGALLAVAKGSDQPPRVVVLEHRGGTESVPTIALVGKGVTFDSGGLSIKPNDGMLTMKCDMAGAATVMGVMLAVARLKLPVNVVGYLGLVENMPGGRSFKLGDVLHARNGVTIEVHNTDAEGRLVLADVLSYAVDRGADYLIDLATLTGACVVALGEDVVGAFSNHQPWCNSVLSATRRCGEDTWQMPMYDHYAELIKSDVADIKNVGGRWGGAITAAKFLERFVSEKPWVHLDIAGPAFASSSKPHREGGATGVMVRSLVELLSTFDAPIE